MGVELKPLPPDVVHTRIALHRVAEGKLVASRVKPTTRSALRQKRPAASGMPAFEFEGRTTQVRVEGGELAVGPDGAEERVELRTWPQGARCWDRKPSPMARRMTDSARDRRRGGCPPRRLPAFGTGVLER